MICHSVSHCLTIRVTISRQHEDARVLLTKYSHEKTYRLREALASGTSEVPQPSEPPLPEFEPVVSTIEALDAA